MNPSPQPPHEPHPDHDRGLEFDLSTLMSRRSLGLFLGAGTAAALAACTPGGPTPDASGSGRRNHGSVLNAGGVRRRGGHAARGRRRRSDADPRDRRVRRRNPAGDRRPVPR